MTAKHRTSQRRRLWIILSGLTLILLTSSVFWIENGVVAKARLVRLGQTQAEVVGILGPPDMKYSATISSPVDGLLYGPLQRWWHEHVGMFLATTIFRGRSCPFLPWPQSYPVQIGFDDNGRVKSIRIRDTVIQELL